MTLREFGDFTGTFQKFSRARHDWCATAKSGFARGHLVTHFDYCCRWWSDESHTHVGNSFCKVGILAEEAVTRVDGVGAAALNRIDDRIRIEITFSRGLTA